MAGAGGAALAATAAVTILGVARLAAQAAARRNNLSPYVTCLAPLLLIFMRMLEACKHEDE